MNDEVKTEGRSDEALLWFFDAGLILKAANGVFEVVVASLILVVPPALVLKMAVFITGGELSQDPEDPIMNALLAAAQTFAVHTHYLLASYLVVHGAAKVILVVGILKGKKIAYELFMIALAVFGLYEAYRGFLRHEVLLQILAVFDIILLVLTTYEYQRRYPSRSSERGT